jgi:hypothetical protein
MAEEQKTLRDVGKCQLAQMILGTVPKLRPSEIVWRDIFFVFQGKMAQGTISKFRVCTSELTHQAYHEHPNKRFQEENDTARPAQPSGRWSSSLPQCHGSLRCCQHHHNAQQ